MLGEATYYILEAPPPKLFPLWPIAACFELEEYCVFVGGDSFTEFFREKRLF